MEKFKEVFSARGLIVEEEKEVIELDADEQVDEAASAAGSKRSKRARTSSGSTSSSQLIADSFERTMSKFAPPEKKQMSAEEWYKECSLTDDQKSKVITQLPASSSPPSARLLAAFDEEMLETCGLSKLQQRCWLSLAKEVAK